MVLAVGLFSGALIYSSNITPDAPPTIETLKYAISCGFSTYLIGLIPLEMVIYQTAGFRITFALFIFAPIMVYLLWGLIGWVLSLCILWAVASLASYRTLAVYDRRKRT